MTDKNLSTKPADNYKNTLMGKAVQKKYADILHGSRPEPSYRHPRMTLSNRAKAKAFDAMLYLFGACLIAFSLMGVPLFATLALVAAYLLTVGLLIFYLNKYHKEM